MNMPSYKPAISASEPPPTFIGLVFSLSGWALMEFTLLSYHAGLRAHLFSTLMAVYLVFTSTKRMKLPEKYRPLIANPSGLQHGSSTAAQAGWALLLLVAGAFIGTMVLSDSAFLVSLTAAALTYIPWSRIPLCRERIVVASAVMCIGVGLPLVLPHHSLSPFFFPMSAWLLWLCAIFSILGRIARLWQAERALKAAARSVALQSA